MFEKDCCIMGNIRLYRLLDKFSENFFPKTGRIDATCFDDASSYEDKNFPCHTKDIEWLAIMFLMKIKSLYLTIDVIEEYMKESSLFCELRHDYEQKVVRWQIENSIGLYLYNYQCDIDFRTYILNTLLKLGIDYSAIEEGIEKNESLWRSYYFNRAFTNTYLPMNLYFGNYSDPDLEFQELWFKLRFYEYYERHKKSVDRYGKVKEEMLITKEEASNLKKRLKAKESELLAKLCDESSYMRLLTNSDGVKNGSRYFQI